MNENRPFRMPSNCLIPYKYVQPLVLPCMVNDLSQRATTFSYRKRKGEINNHLSLPVCICLPGCGCGGVAIVFVIGKNNFIQTRQRVNRGCGGVAIVGRRSSGKLFCI